LDIETKNFVFPQYFNCVDSIRTIAALVVVISHYHHFYLSDFSARDEIPSSQSFPYSELLRPLYDFGGNAVQLFWVISGFVFMHVYAQRPTSPYQFFAARFARLYPLHFATLIFVLLLQTISINYVGHWQIYGNNDTRHFLLQLFMASNWSTLSRGLSFNGPIWSVSLEIGAYVMFFLSLGVLRKFGVLAAVPLAAACWAISIVSPSFIPLVRMSVFECAGYFYSGIILYMLFQKFYSCTAHLSAIYSLSLLASGISVLVGDQRASTVSISWCILLTAALVDLRYGNKIAKLKSVGNVSYSLYLVHVPLQMCVLLVADLFFEGNRGFAQSPFLLPIYLISSVLVSFFVYRFYELPVGRLYRNAFNRNPLRV